jgi:hypothetical protein
MDVLTVLATMASVAASMVGFAGLLTAFRAANESLGAYDVNNIRSLLICAVSALLFALLPLPFAPSALTAPAWVGLTILIGANLLFWPLQSPRWMKRQGIRPRNPRLYFVMMMSQAALALLLIVGAFIIAEPAMLYALGVLWFLIAAIVVFVVQVFLLLPMKRDAER